MVIALSNHSLQGSLVWGAATLISFAAPDIYLLTTGKNLPWMAYLIVIGIMVVAGSISIVKMRGKTRAMRQSIG